MSKKKKSREGSEPPDGAPAKERRRNLELRERLDELVELARHLSRHSREMTDDELDHAELRAEWLAEEIWRSAVFGPLGGAATRSPERSSESGHDREDV